tara:strand:+ start:1048 stop:2127 length:1080 start_codon:yes stop_codon:yes gene_type:complete
MIDFFNQTMCIILIILITVLFLKLLYSHKTLARPIETFIDNPAKENGYTIPEGDEIYFDRMNLNTTPAVYSDIFDRLAKDKDFIKELNAHYRKYTRAQKIAISDGNEAKHETSIKLQKEINEIPGKYKDIVGSYNDLNAQYANKKKQLEYIMIDKLNDSEDVTDFNVKNLKLKKRLKDFTDSLRNYNVVTSIGPACGRFMKNVASNTEINLQENTKLDGLSGFSSGTNLIEEKVKIYFINLDGACLTNKSKTDIAIEVCSSNNLKQLFIINEIKNNETYNKYIKLSGRYKPEHIIDALDTSIDYPFFVLSPYSTPGYAVLINNTTATIRPIRNDPYQQFKETYTTNFCDVTGQCLSSSS